MFSSVLRRAVSPALLMSVVLTAVGPAAADSLRPSQPSKPIVLPHHADHGLNSAASSCGHGCLQVTASGFKPAEVVRIRELLRPGWQRLTRADRSGRVCLRWTGAPTRPDVLTFVGLGTNTRSATAGDVSVSVPRIAVYRLD